MSIEAKRITRKKKLEREKLQKLGNYHKICGLNENDTPCDVIFMIIIKGKLIPIDTETNPDMISLAASNSEAYALPMRPKEEVSNLTTLFNDDSRPSLPRSSILASAMA